MPSSSKKKKAVVAAAPPPGTPIDTAGAAERPPSELRRRKNGKSSKSRMAVRKTNETFAHLLSADDRKRKTDWWKICCMWLGFTVYCIGFFAMAYYAFLVGGAAPYLTTGNSLVPAVFHIIGIGSMAVVKLHFDLSPAVGHIEQMHVIIRSRMWLFPVSRVDPCHSSDHRMPVLKLLHPCLLISLHQTNRAPWGPSR